MDLNPIDVQKHLKGVSYPASRDDLVAGAQENGGGGGRLEALRGLDRDVFDSPAEVMEALG